MISEHGLITGQMGLSLGSNGAALASPILAVIIAAKNVAFIVAGK